MAIVRRLVVRPERARPGGADQRQTRCARVPDSWQGIGKQVSSFWGAVGCHSTGR